ncbi:nitrogenase-associated protein [Desulfuromusa kysingii]|uniref:Nitrogenase-associated protein n=1 Tax=Desulfuromusa kysingii TaxID=37625 RepID=A0A1H4DIQ5_9BACT|nr:ArsC/Spx/MgsR family protein [Desulfuromusa kysingii]SEA72416.1 nitrogenase-associated protein [Desulfuromusa kysingii]
MAHIIFWEKPGCQGNRRQKEILIASGHQLEVRDLLIEPWTPEVLTRFFTEQPLAHCFNPTHPRIKSAELIPTEMSREDALKLMVADPLLIVRPLMQVGNQRLAGFDVKQVHNWVGLALASVGERDPKHCPCVTTVADQS